VQISGLHGDQTLTMNFSNAYTVYVAENGSGKTTALYIFQNLLKRDFDKLKKINFSALNIKFRDEDEISVPYAAFASNQRYDSWIIEIFGHRGLESELAVDIMRFIGNDTRAVLEHPHFRRALMHSGMPAYASYHRPIASHLFGPLFKRASP
jgi:hypothetical protein